MLLCRICLTNQSKTAELFKERKDVTTLFWLLEDSERLHASTI